MTDQATPQSPMMPDQPMQSAQPMQPADPSTPSHVDDYVPPVQPVMVPVPEPVADTVKMDDTSSAGAPAEANTSEAIEDQNIFDMLGITEADEKEKEEFLDELQQVIWEDFVDKDVELLLTEDELKAFKVIADNESLAEDDRQAQMVEYLEKLIPDLEKIMLEKALELKEDMARQRLTEYLEHYKDNPTVLAQVQQAQQSADAKQWRSMANTLNAIPITD